MKKIVAYIRHEKADIVLKKLFVLKPEKLMISKIFKTYNK